MCSSHARTWLNMTLPGSRAGEWSASVLQAEAAGPVPVLGVHCARHVPENLLLRHRGPHLVLHRLLAGRLCTRRWQASLPMHPPWPVPHCPTVGACTCAPFGQECYRLPWTQDTKAFADDSCCRTTDNAGKCSRALSEGTACCRFLCFYAILFLVHQTAAAMFRLIAALTRNLVLATSLGSLFLVIYLMLSGFIQAQRMSCPEHPHMND